MKRAIELVTHNALKEKPPVDRFVLVAGGVAYWNGKDWISASGSASGSYGAVWEAIPWIPLWWAHLIRDHEYPPTPRDDLWT